MGLLSTAARTVADWVKLGYPESVAKRIVSGDLPMDKASRMKRAEEQGYDVDNVQYHGTRADINEFNPSRVGEFGGGVYTTDAPKEASSYASIKRGEGDGSALYPVLTKGEMFDATDSDFWYRFMREGDTDEDVVRRAREAGYDGVLKNRPFSWYDNNTRTVETDGTEIQHRNIFDPSNIRSVNAAFDPQYKGANILGSALLPAATAGLLATQSDDAEAGFVSKGGKTLLEAWHGSPHKFDEFSMDKIGTGEGAQAYGHGLYFADSEDVARGYREALTKSGQDIVDVRLKKADGDIDKAIADAEARAEKYRQGGATSYAESVEEDLRFLRQFKETGKVDDGALYRTEIDVTPESLLDWDKPLSEQSDYVRATLSDKAGINSKRIMSRIMDGGDSDGFSLLKDGDGYTAVADNAMFNDASDFRTKEEALNWLNERVSKYAEGSVNGSDVYRALTNEAGSDGIGQSIASNYLRENGIKGIKYLDGNSRGAGDGTSNYVIFDDSLINIAERGRATPGMMAAVAGTAGGASAIAAMRDEVVDSLLNYSDDRAKKDADRRIPDARTIDEQRIANHRREVNERMHELGMLEDPLYTYRDFMPFKKNIVTGERSLAVPSSVRGMIRGLLDVGSTPRTGVYNPESLLELL